MCKQLPSVFRLDLRPWVDPNAVEVECILIIIGILGLVVAMIVGILWWRAIM